MHIVSRNEREREGQARLQQCRHLTIVTCTTGGGCALSLSLFRPLSHTHTYTRSPSTQARL